jgi:hypothetical protein
MMRNLLSKIKSLLYVLLFLTKPSNDYTFKYVDLENYLRSTSHNNTTTTTLTMVNDDNLNVKNITSNEYDDDNKMSFFERRLRELCHYERLPATGLSTTCYLTLVPCGDVHDWSSLVESLTGPRKPSSLSDNEVNSTTLNAQTYQQLLKTRAELHDKLNKVRFSIRKHYIINIVQEKLLGRNGNSYYYLKHVKQLDIPDGYVSFNYVDYMTKYQWTSDDPASGKENTCDYLELTVFDERAKFIERKVLSKKDFELIKAAYPSLFRQPPGSGTTALVAIVNDHVQIRENISMNADSKVKVAFKTKITIGPSGESKETASTTTTTPVTSDEENNTVTVVSGEIISSDQDSEFNETASSLQGDAASGGPKRTTSMRFYFSFETTRFDELNLMYRKYLAASHLGHSEDYIAHYVLLQDKLTRNLFLNMKTKRGKYYSNELHWSYNENRFYFKFTKSNYNAVKMKNIEAWNLLRYDVYVPVPNCANFDSADNEQNKAVLSSGGQRPSTSMANLINCDNFDEKIFFDELAQRGKTRFLTSNRAIYRYIGLFCKKHNRYGPLSSIFRRLQCWYYALRTEFGQNSYDLPEFRQNSVRIIFFWKFRPFSEFLAICENFYNYFKLLI